MMARRVECAAASDPLAGGSFSTGGAGDYRRSARFARNAGRSGMLLSAKRRPPQSPRVSLRRSWTVGLGQGLAELFDVGGHVHGLDLLRAKNGARRVPGRGITRRGQVGAREDQARQVKGPPLSK